MNRTEKQTQIESLRSQFDRASFSIVAEYKGLSTAQLTELRSKLREVGGQFRVVKNTLARRAVADHVMAPLTEHFKGAVGVVFAFGDAAGAAKVVKEFAKSSGKFSVSAGVIEAEVLDVSGVNQIADLPSREELLAKLVGSINAPVSGLVNVLSGSTRALVYALAAVADKKAA